MARFTAKIWLRCKDRVFVMNWSPFTIISTFVAKSGHLCIKIELVHFGAAENRSWLHIMEELFSLLACLLLALSIYQWTFTIITNLLFDQLFVR